MSKDFTYGMRVKDSQNHWQNVDVYNINITKPTVLVLGGNGTSTDTLANGSAKVVASMLGVFADDTDLIAVNYNSAADNLAAVDQNCTKLANQIFLPLVSNQCKKINPLVARRNIRQITIFAHCFGDKVANYLMQGLQDILEWLRYSPQERRQICEQVFVVTYGITSFNPHAKVLNVISPCDEMFPKSGHKWWKLLLARMQGNLADIKRKQQVEPDYAVAINPDDLKYLANIDLNYNQSFGELKQFYQANQRCYVMKMENTIHLVPSRLRKDMEHDHYIKGLTRRADWQPHPNATPAGDIVSKCLACGLCNSVANSLKNNANPQNFEPLDMLELKQQLEQVVYPLNSAPTVYPSSAIHE